MAKTTFTVDRDKLEVRIERVFDAPRERVWQAMTDPAQIPLWWGPSRYGTTVDKLDMKVGGSWRFIQRDDDGNEFAFSGEHKEVVPNERIVRTFEYEPMPGHISHETMTMEDLDGKTRVTTTSRFASPEDLAGMVDSGMESGAVETYERLAELVEKA